MMNTHGTGWELASISCSSNLSLTPRISPAPHGGSKEKMLLRNSAMAEHSASSSADMSREPCGKVLHHTALTASVYCSSLCSTPEATYTSSG